MITEDELERFVDMHIQDIKEIQNMLIIKEKIKEKNR